MSHLKIVLSALALLGGSQALAASFEPAASATNQLGLEVIRQLAGGRSTQNLLISPYSIEGALSLAFAGAEGETRKEMARVLHLPEDDAAVQASFAAVRKDLGGLNPASELSIANRLFGQSGYPFLDPFLAQLRNGYEAPFEPLDFRSDAESARATINSWVKTQTREKITDLIPPGGVNGRTRLVLVNAAYFKGMWVDPFEAKSTKVGPFYLTPRNQLKVPTMHATRVLGYAKQKDLTAISLPYLGNLQLLVLLPDSLDGLAALTGALKAESLRNCANLPAREIELFLPKLHLSEMAIPLGAVLRSLGMKTAFDEPRGSANFARIAPRQTNDYLAIQDVFHETNLDLDEQGTEASAGTGVVHLTPFSVSENPAPPPPIVRVDHPFLIAIQDRRSGMCLFLGQIVDPR